MSDKEKTEGADPAPKKKKGKLPVLLALVAILGGGGFFAMKMRAPKEQKLELGEIVTLEQEFLSNLKDANVYVRVHLALQLKKGFEKKKLEDKMPAATDAIYMILSNKSQAQLRSIEGKIALKREIASALNGLLEADAAHGAMPEGKKEPEPKEEPKADGKSKEKTSGHSDWDSEAGPVLKVYFTSFATQ